MTDTSIGDAATLMSEIAQMTKKVLVPRLQEALLDIPEGQAFALEMSFIEGETDERIASMMQVPTAVEVHNLKRQAKESLMQTQLGQELETKERLETALKLAGRYWQEREKRDAEGYRQAIEEARAEALSYK